MISNSRRKSMNQFALIIIALFAGIMLGVGLLIVAMPEICYFLYTKKVYSLILDIDESSNPSLIKGCLRDNFHSIHERDPFISSVGGMCCFVAIILMIIAAKLCKEKKREGK